MAMLEGKLEEAGVRDRTELRSVLPRDVVRIGKSFFVEYIRNTHSIADSFTVAIHTPLGIVIHTGDFKIDHTPVDGERFDLQRLAEHGEKGVLCLLSDSTNSEVPGFTPSERSVYPNLDRVFSQATGRLFVTTFASSVHRINMILELAQKHNRTVTIVGRSMGAEAQPHSHNCWAFDAKFDCPRAKFGLHQVSRSSVATVTFCSGFAR